MRIQDSVRLDISNVHWQTAIAEIQQAALQLEASGATNVRFDLEWIDYDYAVPALYFMRDETPDELEARMRVEAYAEKQPLSAVYVDTLALSGVFI